MELFFWIELILNFQQGFKNDDGIEIYDRKLIYKNYCKSTFCFDFLPLFVGTLGLLLEMVVNDTANLRVLRILRLLAFLRLLKLPFGSRNRRIASAFSKTDEPNPIVMRILHIFIFIIWVMCLGFGTRAIIISLDRKLELAHN